VPEEPAQKKGQKIVRDVLNPSLSSDFLRFRVFETWGPEVDVLNVVAYSSRFEVRPHVLVWLVPITVRLPDAHQMVLGDLQYRNFVPVML